MRDTTVDGKMQRGMFLVRDLPNDKIDLNSGAFSDSPFSTDLPFLQHGWPLGGPQERYVCFHRFLPHLQSTVQKECGIIAPYNNNIYRPV